MRMFLSTSRRTARHSSTSLAMFVAALSIGAGLAGCSGIIPESSDFKPLPSANSFLPQTSGDFARASVNSNKPVTPADLVDGQGQCAGGANEGFGRGVGLDMTECEVVRTIGPPASTQIGKNARGERSVEMVYTTGERAGLYRFTGGRLVEVERTEAAREEKPAAKPKKRSQS